MKRLIISSRSKNINELLKFYLCMHLFMILFNILSIRNDRKISNIDSNNIINQLIRYFKKKLLFSSIQSNKRWFFTWNYLHSISKRNGNWYFQLTTKGRTNRCNSILIFCFPCCRFFRDRESFYYSVNSLEQFQII